MKNFSITLLTLLPLIACGGPATEAAPPSSAAPPEAPSEQAGAAPAPAEEESVVGPPDVAWKDMTKDQRARFMKAVVMPKMKGLFQAFDAKHFEGFTCKTCHGPGLDDKSFEMPNPELPRLPATPEGFQALMKEEPQWVKFMGEQVKPQMATLLGLPEVDPQHPDPGAFGCGNCHASETK
jgi:hypothetical protein